MRTKTMLEQIVGVGSVDVMVTVDSTEELVVQRNMKDTQELTEETDANGGNVMLQAISATGRSSLTIQPVIKRPLLPRRSSRRSGVLVVAKGAENEIVKSLIVDAIQRGLNVPSYRISVVPRKQ